MEDVWNGNELGKNRGDENLLGKHCQHRLCKSETKLENIKYFNYLDRKIANDGGYTRGTETTIIVSKAAINKEEALFTNKLNLSLRKN
jgi:hypothetical protein